MLNNSFSLDGLHLLVQNPTPQEQSLVAQFRQRYNPSLGEKNYAEFTADDVAFEQNPSSAFSDVLDYAADRDRRSVQNYAAWTIVRDHPQKEQATKDARALSNFSHNPERFSQKLINLGYEL